MLGVGWTEMLVIGVMALIFIGPKELPAMMRKLGQFTATVRRMGNDFQRELNKTTGLDEVKNLRNAITAPLKETTNAIRKEFNTVGASGEVKPSGVIKPADPKAESVVDEIKAAAGMTPAESIKAAVTKAAVTPAVVAAAAPAKRVRKVKAAPTAPVETAELSPARPTPKRATPKAPSVDSPPPETVPPVRKPAKPKATAPARKPAAKKT